MQMRVQANVGYVRKHTHAPMNVPGIWREQYQGPARQAEECLSEATAVVINLRGCTLRQHLRLRVVAKITLRVTHLASGDHYCKLETCESYESMDQSDDGSASLRVRCSRWTRQLLD